MRTALKYAILLALVVAIGFYIVYGPVGPEGIAPIPVKREAPVGHVEPAPSASIDEELDYLAAKRLGSLAGWRAFLAAHASGAYAQFATAEVERRLPTENAAAEAAVARVAAEEDIAPIPAKREAAVAHVAPAPSASIDEELDYLVAKRLRSLAGWRAFLATHGSGAYAQSARAEVERLLPTGKAPALAAAEVSNGASTDASAAGNAMGAIPSPRGTEVASGYATPAPAAAEVSNDASPDAKAVNEAARPTPPLAGTDALAGTEVAALTPDEVCKRDGDRLARLRSSPSSNEAVRFANELGCESLRPQVLALMESSGYAVPAPVAADVSNGASPDAKPMSEAARPAPPAPAPAEVSNDVSPDAKPVSEAARPAPPILPFRGTEVAALTPDEVCKRDGDRLAQLGSRPSIDEAARFANELGCEKLRPQVLGLMESLAHAVPAPAAPDVSNGASPDSKAASEAVGPASPPAGTDVAALTPDETCKRDGDRLARLRGSPSGEEAQRFASELSCEKLRPQLLRLLESLGQAVPAPAAAEAPNGAPPDAKAAREAVGPAPPSAGPDLANASAVVGGNAAAPLPAQTSAPQENAVRGVTDKASPEAKAAREAVGPAPPSAGRDLANASAVVGGNAAAPLPAQTSAPQENAVRGVTDKASPDAKAAREAVGPAPPSAGQDLANASAVVGGNAAAPLPAQTSAPQENAVRGVTDKEIAFGMAAPFSGASRELGRQMKIGVETAFSQINDAGGVNGRLLRLVSADDGYEPTRTADAMQVLYDKDHVFGFIGNVGTPTAAVALPFALDHRALFFGAFSGANLLRRDPPDRYVFNYRASYAEETNAVVRYLVKVRRIQPKEIVVFAQQDSYGDSGYAGVEKAVRSLPGDYPDIVRLSYKRNTVDVQDAVNGLRAFKGQIKAVVMVASYRAAAKFIEKTRDLYPSLIYTNVSFVGSTALADELTLLGPRYAAGVIVTQVVPAINSYASIVLKYKEALAKYFPGEAPDYVSFEGYIDANILARAVKSVGRDINTEKLVDELEQTHDFDLGLGTPVSFSSNEHQGSHKVWGSQLDEAGHYQPIDLQ